MAEMGSYNNVFDDQNEFNKLNDLVMDAIQKFSDYRKGNLTYGEIMFVLECILDSLRGSSEKDAATADDARKMGDAPSFSKLLAVNARLTEILVKKDIISLDDESYILHGEE